MGFGGRKSDVFNFDVLLLGGGDVRWWWRGGILVFIGSRCLVGGCFIFGVCVMLVRVFL